jgi:hypothetical protein
VIIVYRISINIKILNGANCVNSFNIYEYKDYIYKYNNMNTDNNLEFKSFDSPESRDSESQNILNHEWTILLTNNDENSNESKTEKGGFLKKIKTVSKRVFSKKHISKNS